MAKVLFVNPVVREEQVPRHVPYGMALLAALAIREGHLVQVYDANAWRQGDDVLRQVLEADDWDVVATGGISTAYGYLKKVCRMARAHAPRSMIVAGGGFLTAMPRDILRLIPEIDVGVVGEAFATFLELLAQVDAGRVEPAKIAGVVHRGGPGGAPVLTPERELLEDLDTLPYPAWELFPLEEVYFKNSQALFSEEGMTARRRLDVNASYGCSLICRFCFHLGTAGDLKHVTDESGQVDVQFDAPGSYSRTIRYHSPAYVIGLIKHIRARWSVDFVGFLDENLMTMDQYSGRKWLRAICEGLIAEGLQPRCVREGVPHDETCTGVHWGGTSHATLCTKEILGLMRQAGCSHLVYGYESFSSQVLKKLGKGSTPETNVRSFAWTLEAGIRPIPNQIIGFPSEDFESLRDSLRAWDRLGIMVKPFFATPYPGSEWYHVYKPRILAQYGGDLDAFLEDLGDATDITAVISENFDAVELYGLREVLVRRDVRKLDEYERTWRARREARTKLPVVSAPGAS